jgi:hypothetical protein
MVVAADEGTTVWATGVLVAVFHVHRHQFSPAA